jgi:phospholipase A1
MVQGALVVWLLAATLLMSAAPASAGPDASKDLQCEAEATIIDRRICYERGLRRNAYAFIPYKPSYFVYSHTDTVNRAPFGTDGGGLENHEVKFQFSFKTRIWSFGPSRLNSLYFGYTQKSWWQMINWDQSAPFRESNYEPEFFLLFPTDGDDSLGMRLRFIQLGLAHHQSNGQSGPRSRSWNRSYVQFIFERGHLYASVKPWIRWHEGAASDDNPHIENYMGDGEVIVLYTRHDGWRLSLKATPNVDSDMRIGVELGVSRPFGDSTNIRWYVQYYDGYGESLIDYDHYTRRVGAGIMLFDWL